MWSEGPVQEHTPTAHVALTRGDAHDALQALARMVTGIDAVRLVHACQSCGSSRHGTPWILTPSGRIQASVSRPVRPGPAVVAVCLDGAVGVDIEKVCEADFDGVAHVVQHPLEDAVDAYGRALLWVRKEALLKAHGMGLTVDPRAIALSRTGQVLVGPSSALQDLDVGPGWVCAVAMAFVERFDVCVHELSR